MAYKNLQEFINVLEKENELVRIKEYIELVKENQKKNIKQQENNLARIKKINESESSFW